MEDKKMLNSEELEKVTGGFAEDGYVTVCCCLRDKTHTIAEGNHFGQEYGNCPRCHSKMLGVVLNHNGTVEQVKEGYDFLIK